MRIEITMRSGAQLYADIDDEFALNIRRSGSAVNALAGIEWVASENWAYMLLQIDITEVVGIVAIKQPWPFGVTPGPSQLMTVTDIKSDLHDAGVAQERARIVAMLRGRAPGEGGNRAESSLEMLAAEIEGGAE